MHKYALRHNGLTNAIVWDGVSRYQLPAGAVLEPWDDAAHQPEVVADLSVAALDFMRLFRQPQKVAVLLLQRQAASADLRLPENQNLAVVAVSDKMLSRATRVRMDHPETVAAVSAFERLGVFGTPGSLESLAERDRVLSATFP